MYSTFARGFPALAVAATMALAAAPESARADHCKGPHKNDLGCASGGGGGGGTLIFSVAVVGDPAEPDGGNLWLPSVTAQTNSGTVNSPPSTAIFPRHDVRATLTTSTGATLTDDIKIRTITERSGAITGVQVTGQDTIGEAGLWHQSDVIPVDPPALPDAAGYTLHVHGADVAMWKCDTHLLKKQTRCDEWVGTFSLEDMIYTPDP